jgi:hypothetical protein
MTTWYLLSANLALTSPTSDGRSVGIVCSRTQATELSFLVFFNIYWWIISYGIHLRWSNLCFGKAYRIDLQGGRATSSRQQKLTAQQKLNAYPWAWCNFLWYIGSLVTWTKGFNPRPQNVLSHSVNDNEPLVGRAITASSSGCGEPN